MTDGVSRPSFPLPETPGLFLAYVGMETDLIFGKGIDLPGFASFPLLETDKGREMLRAYFVDMVALARRAGTGVILESPTWVASRDRGAEIGYSPQQLVALNKAAIALMAEVRATALDVPIVLSGNIGPRADAYAPAEIMSAEAAEAYHEEQVSALADTDVDVISGYTLAHPAEAVGLARAARRNGLPVVISFTVETDGTLPTGIAFAAAIAEVDAETDEYPAYYMINCAHPDHFRDIVDGPGFDRVQGIVANASRCSHAELDEAEVLDDGDPQQLGLQLANLRKRLQGVRVLGGCCGTDMRHMAEITRAAARP